jgi:hypothetical protein
MHGPINVKSPNNISKWHMGFNSAFKGLNRLNILYNVVCEEEEETAVVYTRKYVVSVKESEEYMFLRNLRPSER